MIVEKAFVNARGVDSYPYSIGGTAEQAQALADRGVDFVVGYLGVMDSVRLGYILDAGLAFMPVTLAGHADGAAAIDACRGLGLPPGVTVWLDLEGQSAYHTQPDALMTTLNAWAHAVAAAGYIPGLYVGSPQPLTGDELAHLAFVRYWCAASRVLDRQGVSWDEPTGCGFCMRQSWPQGEFLDTGVLVDGDWITSDRKGRVPTWVRELITGP